MPARRANSGRRVLCLGVLILFGTCVTLGAADPEPAKKKDDPAPPAKGEPTAAKDDAKPEPGAKAAAEKGKTYAFEFRAKPWKDVLEWFSDISGLPFIGSNTPTGSFTFISPKNGPRQYTVPQIVDILNEALVGQKFILVRRTASYTLVPADEKINPAELPRVELAELERRGNTELASVVLRLNTLVAEDLANEVKKMMGPFGEVVALAQANQLVLQDTTGNLKRIVNTIRDIEDNEKGNVDTFTHPCKYIKARDAERILKDLLGDPQALARANQPADRGTFTFDRSGGFLGGSGGGVPMGGSSRDRSDRGDRSQQGVTPKVRMHYISSDERTNSVLVTGPANKIAQARDIMKRLDVEQPGQQPVMLGPPILKTYQVPGGTADAMAKTLQEHYKNSHTIRISAVGTSTILSLAGPDDQIDIARHILGSTGGASATEVVTLNSLDASKAVDSLKGMFADAKTGGPYLEADTTRNALIIRGTGEQVADIRAALKAMGEGGGPAGNMRIITLNQGSAATLAEALERLMSQMRKNPVQVIVPGETPKPEPKEQPKDKPKDGSSQAPGRKLTADDPNAQLVAQAEPQLKDPQKDKGKDDKPGRVDKPVKITAFGNKIIITSDDPEALALAQELIRLLTTTPGGEGDFEVIKLKNASATEAAKILDEAFNGVKRQDNQQNQQGAVGFFQRFSAPQAAPPPNPAANRIRVVADPATNSLLIRASPLDMLTIRRLLEKAIDSAEIDSKAVARTWIIGPLKYATATEVASVVRDVYRENMNQNPTANMLAGSLGGFSRLRSPSNMNVDANGNPRGVALSVGVDDRTNSLIVNCSEAMYQDVKKLVDQLEAAAKDSTRTVRVVSIKGIDPLLVQQAIDAIQGRRTTNSSQNGNRTGTNSGFVPFGTGGMVVPGMTGTTSPFRGGGFQPGGFTPGTSGFQPGGTGFTPGSGGGFRGSGGGGRPPGRAPDRGPDFFGQGVTDDPQQFVLFDPQQSEPVFSSDVANEEQEQQPAGPPAPEPIRGPRAPVTAEALEQLGVIVISGNNPADVEEVLRIIEYIQRLGAGAEVQIQLVPLEFADATSVANTLGQMFQQVIVGATGNIRAPTTAGPTGGATGQTGTAGQPAASVVMIPLPRHNAILLAAPRARVDDVIREIRKLDRPVAPQGQAVAFPLKKASAARVATLIQQFYAQRFPNETSAQNQIRVTEDDGTNTVFVQAAPADLLEIRGLIERIDNTVSSAINDVRIIPLRNALADELANLLLQAISQVTTPSTSGAPGIVPGAGALPGGAGLPGGVRPGGVGGVGAAAGQTTSPGAGAPGVSGQPGSTTKSTTLRFLAPAIKGAVESGLLDDVRITSDPRTNSLVLSAPARTMDLLLALVRELDVLPAARAEVKIFTLKKADAVLTATLLQQLFFGTSGAGGVGGVGGAPGAVGGALGAAAGGAAALSTAGFAGAAGLPRPIMSLGGLPVEGPPLIDLRITVDQRSNSIIVAGSKNDLEVIEAIISRLEDTNVPIRHSEVYRLKNANAADVAAALQNFITQTLTVLSTGQQLTAYAEIERAVVIVPEPISNTLLISATPKYFADIVRLIHELDAPQPEVAIQVLIAEVDLSNSEEFGVEFGLQSPILFARSVIPRPNAFGTGSVTFGAPTAGGPPSVPDGVTVNTSMNPAALPGFNFNTTSNLGNNPLAGPGVVGFQGLQNLGVGRSSPNTPNVGGFVFSIASDAFSLLIRALKTQNRIDVLSRPQITTLDRQAATILVGQSFPYSTGTTTTATGFATSGINYRNIGVQLDVTPQISPDGKVIMRVTPQVSSVAPSTVPLGNGVNAPIFNVQTVDTTVVADDGETVAIGGLITKNDSMAENKIPWLGDLPKLGPLFRYRTDVVKKTELLVIMTPHILRCHADADRILAEEARRMDWVLGDVMKVHATTGMEPILMTRPGVFAPGGHCDPKDGPLLTPPLKHEGGKSDTLPPPRPLPPDGPQSRRPVSQSVVPASYEDPPLAVSSGPAPKAGEAKTGSGLLAPLLPQSNSSK